MKRIVRLGVLPVLVVMAGAFVLFRPGAPPAESAVPGNRVLARELDIETGRAQRTKAQVPVSSGALYAVLAGVGELDRRVLSANHTAPSNARTQGCQGRFTGGVRGANTRVNQDCSLRRQAEEVIAINPTNPDNLIAGMNDSRIGFNHCGYAWSFDGGRTWGDQTPPFYQFVLKDGHTADACSDPTATFDADGNAYVAGILFDVNFNASALVVAKSNAGIGGAFYHSPVPLSFQTYRTTPLGVVASDNDPNVFHDKEFIVADHHEDSPKQNNVYVTWTRFTDKNSPIYFSQSSDGGATWSAGIAISGANAAICTDFSVVAGACDQDQGSHPIVGHDGTLYVAFGNGNTPLVGVNQVLFVKCPAAADCTKSSSWSKPVKVNDLIDNHPTGPSAAGCPAGRQCLPPNGYRVPEFTSISISADHDGNLFTVWSDFRNGGAPCTGPAATATPPCDNDVFYAFSTDGGATWSKAVNVAPASKFGKTAQWQPWSAVTHDGRTLFIGYYDRSYGDCETTGCNDITLARVRNPALPPAVATVEVESARGTRADHSAPATSTITYTRLTTASMPNLTPANNPLQAGFLGDYMWVAVDHDGRANVVWADTRGQNDTVEEDIYFTRTR